MAKNDTSLADGDLFLPLERAFHRRFLRSRRWTLVLWMAGFTAFFLLGMFHSLKYDYHKLIHAYLAPILIGNAVIFGNILFILRTSELAREKLPKVIPLLKDSASRDRLKRSALRKIYNARRLWMSTLVIVMLGELTFAFLGIDVPYITTKIIVLSVIAVIFGLLGTTLGLAVGFWSWMREFGESDPHIDVFHPDKMGGLLPLAAVSDWVVSMGAILAALYSLGAYSSPYEHTDLRAYSYSWILFAIIMLAFAFYVPALSVHRCLVKARDGVAERISKQNERVFDMFEKGALKDTSAVMALMWFSESLGKLNVWPYRQLAARFVGTVALQFVPMLLNLVLSHQHR